MTKGILVAEVIPFKNFKEKIRITKEYEKFKVEVFNNYIIVLRNERKWKIMAKWKRTIEAEKFIAENYKNFSRSELLRELLKNFDFSYSTACRLINKSKLYPKMKCGSKVNNPKYPEIREYTIYGKTLRQLLEEAEKREFEQYKKKLLEEELARPKFFF